MAIRDITDVPVTLVVIDAQCTHRHRMVLPEVLAYPPPECPYCRHGMRLLYRTRRTIVVPSIATTKGRTFYAT